MIANSTESLFLRTWYGLRGTASPFTEEMADRIAQHLLHKYGPSFDYGQVNLDKVSAFVNSTFENKQHYSSGVDPQFAQAVEGKKTRKAKAGVEVLVV